MPAARPASRRPSSLRAWARSTLAAWALLLAGLPPAQAEDPPQARWIVQIENDFLGAAPSDRNYTMGVSYGVLHDRYAADSWVAPGWRALAALNGLTGIESQGAEQATVAFWRLSSTNYTPNRLSPSTPIPRDRPYASLLSLGVGYVTEQSNGDMVDTEFRIGVLGTRIGESVQRAMHELCCPKRIPNGWRNQIGDGGAPTFLYRATWSRLLGLGRQDATSRTHLRLVLGGELGYTTRALAGLRLLHAGTPADVPVLGAVDIDGAPLRLPGPVQVASAEEPPALPPPPPKRRKLRGAGKGMSFWADYELSLVAYNQLLQGAWGGRNRVQFSREQIDTAVHRLTVGAELTFLPMLAGWMTSGDTRLYLTTSWRSRDITTEFGKNHYYGGLHLSSAFD